MAMLTIRNLDEILKSQLRICAAHHGCSMEEEVREILRQTLLSPAPKNNLGSRLHQRFKSTTGGVELGLPDRTPARNPPDFGDESV